MEKKNKFVTTLLAVQGGYFLITALWGLVDIESFMAVTGPKTDIWLVKTVSVLIIPISLCLLSYLFIESNLLPAIITGLTSAIGFAAIDFYYATNDIISNVYMLDGIMQILFALGWIVVLIKRKNLLERVSRQR